jgi:NadR type nicotinamide-nucleotide adenylyltransferase
VWVPEYGREYSEIKLAEEGGYNWSSVEFTHIAQEQCRREDEAARQSNRVLICDTDAFATSIWYRRYMGHRSPEVEAIAAPRHYDLYLLTDINTPFEQDGTRDGEDIRHWMHHVFVAELKAWGKPYIEVSGTPEERLTHSAEAIEALLRTG